MAIFEPVEAPGNAESFQIDERNIATYQTQEDAILGVVVQDVMREEERRRTRGQLRRWEDNDRLYLADVPQRNWEGTNQPRAALGVPLVNEHINAINPQIMDVLFEEDPPFYSLGHPSIDDMDVRANNEILAWEIDKMELESEIEMASEDGLLDGDYMLKVYWTMKDDYMCPHAEYVEQKFVLKDSSLRRPDPRKAKWICHKMSMTVRQIDNLRNVEGYLNVPSLEELKRLAILPQELAPQDPNEMRAGVYGTPASSSMDLTLEFQPEERRTPTSIDPMNHPLEVLEYVNKDFVWVVLQRKRLIRNESNRKPKKILWVGAYFTRVRGNSNAMGIAGLNGGEQRLQQGVLNLSLDSLALSIFGMYKRKRGSSVFPQQARVSPGRIVDVDNMDDLDELRRTQVDPTAFNVINESDARAARRSGANEVAIQGSFPQSSGGIGRTAQGMSMLAQASSTRIRKYVKCQERQVIIPILEFLIETNPYYLDAGLVKEILSEDMFKAYDKTAASVMAAGSKMKFKMLGATKLKRRAAMLSAVPQMLQFFQQQYVQDALKGQFKVLEFDKLMWMLFDATGWPTKEQIVRNMTQEEQMKMASENELIQQLVTKRALTSVDTQSKIDVADAENAGRMVRDAAKAQMEHAKTSQELHNASQTAMGVLAATDHMNQQSSAMGMMPVGDYARQGSPVGSPPLGTGA